MDTDGHALIVLKGRELQEFSVGRESGEGHDGGRGLRGTNYDV